MPQPQTSRWQFLKGLRAKFILLLIVPSVLIISLLLVIFRGDLREAMVQQYVEDGLILTGIVQQQFEAFKGLPTGEVAPQILSLVLQQRPQYTHLVLRTPSGEVIGTGPTGFVHAETDLEAGARVAQVVATGKTSYILEETEETGPLAGQGLWLETVSPIMTHSSVMAVLISHRPLGQESYLVQVIMRDAVVIAVVGNGLLLVLFFAGVYLIFLRRLQRLSEASKQITRGHYETQAVISGHDELTALGETFNGMARSIDLSMKNEKALNAQLATLNGVAAGLAGSFDLDYLLDRLADGVCRLTGADGAVLYLVDSQTLDIRTVKTKGVELEEAGRQGNIHEKGLFGLAVRTRQHLLIEETREHPGAIGTPGHHPAFNSLLLLPMLAGDRLLGAVVAGRAADKEPFRYADLNMVQSLVLFGATAIDKALLYAQSEELARTDGLTGLYNHREFQLRLGHEIDRSQRYLHPLSLLLVDLDHFKRVNDEHGHMAGDAVLKAVAVAMLAGIRTIDVGARYGGEEFAVVLPETALEGALVVAQRLRAQIAALGVVGPSGRTLSCSVSIGVASYPVDAPQKEALINASDKALYYAKYSGRNVVKTYQEFLQADFTAPPVHKRAP